MTFEAGIIWGFILGMWFSILLGWMSQKWENHMNQKLEEFTKAARTSDDDPDKEG